MPYTLNQQFELNVRDLRIDTNTGNEYAVVYDDDREYRIYNLLKGQRESLPDKMYIKCTEVDAYGRYKLRQDEARLFSEHYEVGKLYAFEVKEVKMDYNSDTPYYLIEDDFASHHYYFQGENKYQAGDDCILEVYGFTDRGYLKLKEVEYKVDAIANEYSEALDNRIDVSGANIPTLDVEEGKTLELKTSIVFPPDESGTANIDKQIYNIIKEIAAFMNTDGGELYIGVHDRTKKVIGIQGDFDHLNDGDEDKFAGTYNANKDGYELKIRNTIDRMCPSIVNSMIDVEFPEIEGAVYCKIKIQPTSRPIFIKGTHLWVRQGNRLKQLTGDEITFFVTSRMSSFIKENVNTDDMQNGGAGLDMDSLMSQIRSMLNECRPSVALPKPKDLGEVDYWIVWYDNATWKRQRQKSEEPNVYIQVPVLKNVSNPRLVFCYESGKVNVVELSKFRKGVNINVLNAKNAWSKTGERPMAIFIAQPSDYLVGYSVDSNSIEYVKLHVVSDYGEKKSATNAGSPFVPAGCVMTAFKIIGAEHQKRVEHLISTKQRRSQECGTPLTSPTLADEIKYVAKVQ